MHAAGIFIRLALVLTLVCNLAPTASAGQTDGETHGDAIGTVVYLTGRVTAERIGEPPRQLAQDNPVHTGDVIVTGELSSVEIVFRDRSVFSQGADSRTSLDEFVYSADPGASKMLLKMAVGTVRYVTGKVVETNPEAFALDTPTTTIGIRGTGIFAVVSPEQEQIGVLDMTPGHTVSVTSARQSRTIDRTGLSVSVSPDGRITPPAPIAPETRSRVIKAAPQTSQGEQPDPASVSRSEIHNRINAFDEAMKRTKSELGGVGSRPSYGDLHKLSLLEESRQSAVDEQSNPSAPAVPDRAVKTPIVGTTPPPPSTPKAVPNYPGIK